MHRTRSAARVLRIALTICVAVLALRPAAAFAQYSRPGVASVPYVYGGTTFTIVSIRGQAVQVKTGTQIVLMISNGNVIAYPGIDAHLVAQAEDALKAFQAGTPSGTSAAPAAGNGGTGSGLTVDGVIAMLNAGISDDLIIEKIHKSGQSFDLSADQMVALKNAKASDSLM